MKRAGRASALAWVAVAVLTIGLVVQAWPEHPDKAGSQSTIGVVR
jgi:hypothetical protein